MRYLYTYKTFENSESQMIRDYIDDVFFEFSDNYSFDVDIVEDESIHEAPVTTSVLFGKNFVYPTLYDKRFNRLPGMYNLDWKLGFLVHVSCKNPISRDEYSKNMQLINARGRKKRLK